MNFEHANSLRRRASSTACRLYMIMMMCVLYCSMTVDVMIPKVVDVDILSGSDMILELQIILDQIPNQARKKHYSCCHRVPQWNHSTPDTIEPG